MNGSSIINVLVPTNDTDAANKKYVDDGITSALEGPSWKAPVDDADGPDGGTPDTLGSYECNATNESWATYNSAESLIYVCSDVNGDGSLYSWTNIGSTAVIPNLSGEVSGDISSTIVEDNVIDNANVKSDAAIGEQKLLPILAVKIL